MMGQKAKKSTYRASPTRDDTIEGKGIRYTRGTGGAAGIEGLRDGGRLL